MENSVYFIGSIELGSVKIGISNDPLKRLQELQVGNPYKLTLYGTVDDVTGEYESYVHEMFKEDRQNGEWFKLTDKLIQYMMHKATSDGVKYKIKGKYEVPTLKRKDYEAQAIAIRKCRSEL